MVKGNTFSNGVCCLQVNNPDGIVSGGNQFKVNEHGVILGNVGTGGSVQVSPLSCSLLQKFAQSSKCNRDKIHTYKHITGIHAMRITFSWWHHNLSASTGTCAAQLANDGGVTIDPGTAGNLWNLARSAAHLYGRKLQEHTA